MTDSAPAHIAVVVAQHAAPDKDGTLQTVLHQGNMKVVEHQVEQPRKK